MKTAILFFGLPGSGKGTQADLLNEYLNKDSKSALIGMGAELRKAIENSEKEPVFAEIKEIVRLGKLTPTALVIWVFFEWFKNNYNKNNFFILDGSGRKKLEACLVHELLSEFNFDKIIVIYLDVTEQEIMKRLLLRNRMDDKEEIIKDRIEIFKDSEKGTMASVNYLKEQKNIIFKSINGEGDIEEVFNRVKEVL